MKTSLKSVKTLFFVICFISIFINSTPLYGADWDPELGQGGDAPKKLKGKREVGGQDREDSPLLGNTPTSSSPALFALRSAAALAQRGGTDTPPTASKLELAGNDRPPILDEDSGSGSFGDVPNLLAPVNDSSRGSFSSLQAQSMQSIHGSQLQRTLAQMYFDGHNAMDKSSIIIYTVEKNRRGLSWDNNTEFMRTMDIEFFNQERSWKVLGSGAIAAVVGLALPSTPATGSIMWGIGNALKIPISGWVSNLIVSEIMITMSPMFGRQFFTRGQIVMRKLACEQGFPPGHEDNRPHVIDPIFIHTAFKFVVGAAALVEGTFYFGLAYVAEGQEFRGISLGMGPFLALAFAERYYTVGVRSLDRFFVRYYYDTAVVSQQRDVLIAQAKRALVEVEKNNRFVSEIYRIVQRELNYDENTALGDINPQHYFALSALFLRHLVSASEGDDVESKPLPSQLGEPSLSRDREDISRPQSLGLDDTDTMHRRAASVLPDDRAEDNVLRRRSVGLEEDRPQDREMAVLKARIAELERGEEDLSSDNKKLQTFKALVDRMTPSAKEAFMDYMSIFLTGAGDFARLLGRQYILELVLEQIMSVDPTISANTAWCLAATDILIRNVLEFNVQKENMRGWLNTFSLKHLVDFQILRKSLGCVSFVNGGWFGLANTIASIFKFQTMAVPMPLQVVCVIPAFLQDQGYVSNFYSEQANEFITDVATMKLECAGAPSTLRKRAWCHLWIKRLIKFLDVADGETISVLFNKTQRAL